MDWYESCLKPIVEILTLIGVIIALLFQSETIKKQNEEFKRQKIKDSKSEFISLFNVTMSDYALFIDRQGGGLADRAEKKGFKQSFIDCLNLIFNNYIGMEFSQYIRTCETCNNEQLPLEYKKIKLFLDENGPGITTFVRPYFLLIESILILLDDFKIVDSEEDNIKLKKEYFNYFSSKLKDTEAHLIMLYCITDKGIRLKEIIEKYSILEHNYIYPFFDEVKSEFKNSAFKSN